MKQRPIKLPEDMQPHDTTIEWWYFNGHLADAKGNQYSFMDCLFRADVNKAKIPYLKNFFGGLKIGEYVTFAHSVFGNITEKKSYKDIQNISLTSRDSFTYPLFFVNYIDPISAAKGFVLNEIAETKPGTFHIKTEWIDLVMESKKKPMLEGRQGFVTVRNHETFYYSLTDLETKGSVRVRDQWIPVTGRSWMDHQWAEVAYNKDKWTWFSIQLDDGTDLMCVEYDDGKGKDHLVSMLDARGNAEHYERATFTPDDKIWKSKTTKAKYPLSWTVTIPEKDLALKISSTLSDEEMIFGAIAYWESPVIVTGTIGKKKVKGIGFMELAGYPTDYNFLFLTGKKVNKRLQEEFSSRIRNVFK
jgi:predicted secreted hydrolase